MGDLRRLVLQLNLDETLHLWLRAIQLGQYDRARDIMDWRTALRAELARVAS